MLTIYVGMLLKQVIDVDHCQQHTWRTDPDGSIIFSIIFLGIVKEKGVDNVTVDDLIDQVTPKARGMFSNTLFFYKNT